MPISFLAKGKIPMTRSLDAIYENGIFRPLSAQSIGIADGQRVRISVDDQSELEPLQLLARVYEGLSSQEMDEVEQIAVDRSNFFGGRATP